MRKEEKEKRKRLLKQKEMETPAPNKHKGRSRKGPAEQLGQSGPVTILKTLGKRNKPKKK